MASSFSTSVNPRRTSWHGRRRCARVPAPPSRGPPLDGKQQPKSLHRVDGFLRQHSHDLSPGSTSNGAIGHGVENSNFELRISNFPPRHPSLSNRAPSPCKIAKILPRISCACRRTTALNASICPEERRERPYWSQTVQRFSWILVSIQPSGSEAPLLPQGSPP
jgi:hypothetical protein